MTGLGTASADSAGQQPTSTRLRLTSPISLAAPISNGVARTRQMANPPVVVRSSDE